MSKAHWRQSSHNWNAGIDLFRNVPNHLYEMSWFKEVVEPKLTKDLLWYGRIDAPYYELAHVEILGWALLSVQGQLKLVE